MKMTKKKIFAISLIVCAVAIISMGTLAWFTAQDSVTNKFMFAETGTDPDEVFGLDVWETVDGTEYGKGIGDQVGATYKEILPGQILDKNPQFTNTGIHPQFVRAFVKVTGADVLYEAMKPHDSDLSLWYEVERLLPGMSDEWTFQEALWTKDNEFVYVYYYNEILKAGATTDILFDDVVIPTELTLEQADELGMNFTVTVSGQAIQSEHLDPSITTALDAFVKYWDEEGTKAGYKPEDLNSKDYSGELGEPSETIVYNPADYEDGGMVLDNPTANVAAGDELVLIPATIENATIIIDGGNFTLAEGAKIVRAEGGGGLVVYMLTETPVVINGKKVGVDMTEADAELYFENVTVLWY